MKTLIQNPGTPVLPRPEDLPSWLPQREILALTREAARLVTQREPAFRAARFEQFDTATLLALLTFCYATNTYGSDDVEWSVEHDAGARELCAGGGPDHNAVRRFRRLHRQWIEKCLVHLFNLAAPHFVAAFGADEPRDPYGWARRRVELAIITDTAAAD